MAATYSELFAALMAPEYKDMVGKIGYAELPRMERKYTPDLQHELRDQQGLQESKRGLPLPGLAPERPQ